MAGGTYYECRPYSGDEWLRQDMEAYFYKTGPQKEAFIRMLAGALK